MTPKIDTSLFILPPMPRGFDNLLLRLNKLTCDPLYLRNPPTWQELEGNGDSLLRVHAVWPAPEMQAHDLKVELERLHLEVSPLSDLMRLLLVLEDVTPFGTAGSECRIAVRAESETYLGHQVILSNRGAHLLPVEDWARESYQNGEGSRCDGILCRSTT